MRAYEISFWEEDRIFLCHNCFENLSEDSTGSDDYADFRAGFRSLLDEGLLNPVELER